MDFVRDAYRRFFVGARIREAMTRLEGNRARLLRQFVILAAAIFIMVLSFNASAGAPETTYPSKAGALVGCQTYLADQSNGPGDDFCLLYTDNGSNGDYILAGHCCGAGNVWLWNTSLPLAPVPGRTMGPPCSCAGDPINLGTGNEYRDEADADLGALSFHRYYNSDSGMDSTHTERIGDTVLIAP